MLTIEASQGLCFFTIWAKGSCRRKVLAYKNLEPSLQRRVKYTMEKGPNVIVSFETIRAWQRIPQCAQCICECSQIISYFRVHHQVQYREEPLFETFFLMSSNLLPANLLNPELALFLCVTNNQGRIKCKNTPNHIGFQGTLWTQGPDNQNYFDVYLGSSCEQFKSNDHLLF